VFDTLVITRGIRRSVAVVVVGLFVVQGVQAAPAVPPASASAPARPRLVAHAFPYGGAFAAARVLGRAFDAYLVAEDRVEYRSLDSVLLDTTAADQALADADANLATARAKLQDLDLAEAGKLLKAAVATYEREMYRLSTRAKPVAALVNAYRLLTATRYIDGDTEGARDALRRARILDPDLAYDNTLFPPKMRRIFTEVKLLQDELGKGAIYVTSDPPGAEVLVNGAPAGVAPVKVPGLAAGPNYVTLVLTGFVPTTVTVEVVGGEEKRVEQALKRFDDDPAPLVERTRASLGEPTMSSGMRELARRVRADLMVLAFVREDGDTVNVSLYLYDARFGKLVRQVRKSVLRAELEASVPAMLKELDPGGAAAGVIEIVKPPPKRPNRIWTLALKYRHWKYFWHSVAIAGALVLTSIVVGVAVSAQDRGLDPRWGAVLTGRGLGVSF
jgi:hypothetical protein